MHQILGGGLVKIGKIEQKVKIPEVHSKIRYPWPDMKVGDSVLLRRMKGKGFILSSARSAVCTVLGPKDREAV